MDKSVINRFFLEKNLRLETMEKEAEEKSNRIAIVFFIIEIVFLCFYFLMFYKGMDRIIWFIMSILLSMVLSLYVYAVIYRKYRFSKKYIEEDISINYVVTDNHLICRKNIIDLINFVDCNDIQYKLHLNIGIYINEYYTLVLNVNLQEEQYKELLLKLDSCTVEYLIIPLGTKENFFLENGYLYAVKNGTKKTERTFGIKYNDIKVY